MKKQDAMKSQAHTYCLRVDNIHCDGCKAKIRKLLMKIDGVYATSIDVEQGKVAVTGNVDPAVLIRKLEKSGKHAETWRNNNNNNNNNKSIQFDLLNNQFKSLQMGSVKGGGGDKKPQHKGGKDQQIRYQPSVQEMKGSRDLKAPFKMKDQKTVRFDLSKKAHEFDEFSEDDFDEDFDDFSEDDFNDDDDDDDELGYGAHQHQHGQQKVSGNGSKNMKEKKGGKNGGGKHKKGGGSFMSMIGKAIGGKSHEGKNGNVGKKGASVGKSKDGTRIQNYGGGEGKKGNKLGGGGGKGNNSNVNKGGGGGKNGMFSDFEVTNHRNGGGGGGMGEYRIPAAQGPPAAQPQMMNMNGGRGGGNGPNGYYPGAGMGPITSAGNPYQQQQQQQYMAMMMNQQRMMNGGGGGGGGEMMYHPAMYGRPPPGYGYAPPMPQPPAAYHHEPYTHMFSDENTDSCSIM